MSTSLLFCPLQLQDEFYNNVILSMSDFVVVVVGDVSNNDITLMYDIMNARDRRMEDLAKKTSSAGQGLQPPQFVVHNLRQVTTFEQLRHKWLVRHAEMTVWPLSRYHVPTCLVPVASPPRSLLTITVFTVDTLWLHQRVHTTLFFP